MRASIRDAKALDALRPLEVVSYLRATGWSQQQVQPERQSVWTRGNDNGGFEVVVPLARWGDYAIRMSELLATLESAEQRSQLEILTDLSFSNADVVRIRADIRDAADGSIPLDDAIALVDRARDALLAAACSAIQPRAYFAPRKFGQALDYVKRVKMGQTERGSYTVTVISRVAPILQQPDFLSELEEPYERRVVRTLGTGVTRVRAAADLAASTGSLESFKEGVDFGISANLCDALVGMSHDTELLTGLEMSFSWSRTRPQTHEQVPHVLISPDSLPVIEEAGRLLREISPREEFELEGIVVRLDRLPSDRVGLVTVLGFIEGRPHNIRIELAEPDYGQAVLSHDQRRPIFALGDLMREGRSFFLRNPRGVRLINSDRDL